MGVKRRGSPTLACSGQKWCEWACVREGAVQRAHIVSLYRDVFGAMVCMTAAGAEELLYLIFFSSGLFLLL